MQRFSSQQNTKKRVVFAWELGAGFGHVAGFAPLAKRLIQENYDIFAIVRNIIDANTVLGDLPVTLFQAPVGWHVGDPKAPTYNYAQIIKPLGFNSPDALKSLISGWIDLFSIVKPDLVIIDHGPAALLAARIAGYPTCLIGTGFFSPPRLSKLPIFTGLDSSVPQQAAEDELEVLATTNQVLAKFKRAELPYLSAMFDVDCDFLCTFAELDHYPERSEAFYWGPRFDIDIGARFEWPVSNSNHKLFAYIKGNLPSLDKFLASLTTQSMSVVVYIPNIDKGKAASLSKFKNVAVLHSLACIRQVVEESDVICCNAGHGLVAVGLLAGKRMLLMPTQLEQSILTKRLASAKLCAALNPSQSNAFDGALAFVRTHKELEQNAKAFKDKYSHFNQASQLDAMIEACLQLTS